MPYKVGSALELASVSWLSPFIAGPFPKVVSNRGPSRKRLGWV